jgi:histidinol dehydrogenase
MDMIPIIKTEPSQLLKSRWPHTQKENQELMEYVSNIVEDVKERGDQAVQECTERFDKVNLIPEKFLVNEKEIKAAYDEISELQLQSLKKVKERLEFVEKKRLELLKFECEFKGVKIFNSIRPLRSLGCYVPGGKAAYPSTALMNIVPARVAGVKEIVVVTPPNAKGKVNPLTMVAADLCDVDFIYRIGGIQSIAALTFGTKNIKKVDKIVGPGNKYVTAAKNLVSKWVAIDKPAGPTEILIIADDSADPNLISLDLVSQAEHGPGGICGLITDSERLAKNVQKNLDKLKNIPRLDYVNDALFTGGFIYLVKNLAEAIQFIEKFSPEHLEIMTYEPMKIAEKISSAGLILLGHYSPVSATDYLLGVNHVLPTGGYGKIYSGLTVLDFLRTVSIVESKKEGLAEIAENIIALAEVEGLTNHALAIKKRVSN